MEWKKIVFSVMPVIAAAQIPTIMAHRHGPRKRIACTAVNVPAISAKIPA